MARSHSTYRANKVSPRTFANADFVHQHEGKHPTQPIDAALITPARAWRRREGCTTDRKGKPHQHKREIARRLRQRAAIAAKGA
jgi:hypothetical protein